VVKKILVLGTGALGTLFAARLAAAGAQVAVLGTWPEALEALRRRGAQVEGETPRPVLASADPAACAPADLALVLVKSWQTERAARQLAECLSPDGLAVSLQNGLGNDTLLARTLGPRRVSAGVTTLGAALSAPGLARFAGAGPTWLEARPSLDGLAVLLAEAGFPVERAADIRPRQWGKLVINAAINPLTAILRVPNGGLLTDPLARSLLGQLARETASGAEAAGVALPFSAPERAAEEVAERTAANHSSMLRDVLRGAPTEVEAINGAVLREARARGLAAPLNRLARQLVLSRIRLSSGELADMVRLEQMPPGGFECEEV
jgi:2-dehydropantoate 2-reductase